MFSRYPKESPRSGRPPSENQQILLPEFGRGQNVLLVGGQLGRLWMVETLGQRAGDTAPLTQVRIWGGSHPLRGLGWGSASLSLSFLLYKTRVRNCGFPGRLEDEMRLCQHLKSLTPGRGEAENPGGTSRKAKWTPVSLPEAATPLEMGRRPMALQGEKLRSQGLGRITGHPSPPDLCWSKASVYSLPISQLSLGMTGGGSSRHGTKWHWGTGWARRRATRQGLSLLS